MWSRYSCPSCKIDLKVNPPKATKHPWYKLVSRNTRQCTSCGVELERRFADYDMGLATVLTSGGAVSVWGVGKIVLPILAALIVIRLILARLLSVYVLSKRKD